MKLCPMFYGLGVWFGMWYFFGLVLHKSETTDIILAVLFCVIGKIIEKLEG